MEIGAADVTTDQIFKITDVTAGILQLRIRRRRRRVHGGINSLVKLRPSRVGTSITGFLTLFPTGLEFFR